MLQYLRWGRLRSRLLSFWFRHFLLGFTLAYYLPAIPFIIWIMAVFGWVVMVLEALIWAAMHASPVPHSVENHYALYMELLT